ncbi:AAA family ATPase [Salinibacterium sp. G-O1]|uniref:AAA family ATPase n=1 Tax=Salinibacterium sp. G-O1 TaxID=3046208 RepID=UPI0024BA5106|nr:AAA family ATPase [Salinibacterium sp. G-O1]MDJ0335355.1 AAA family ATPase [Salinibacterium sp. G-O1]
MEPIDSPSEAVDDDPFVPREQKARARRKQTGESSIPENVLLLRENQPSKAIVRFANDIKSRRQKFLWQDRIPIGTVGLFAGRGGVGKSTFAIWLAVEAQHGRLPGDLQGERVVVLYVSVEDHWETQMKPRLTAAGADMARFGALTIQSSVDTATGERIPLLPEDTEAVRNAIVDTGARIVILDPITSTVSGDDHKREIVRAVLDPLAKVAGETGSVILGIMHFNKGAGAASDKVSGSHAYRDAARSVMLFAKDEESGHVVMTQDKGNYADFGDMSLEYDLVDTVVELDDGELAHVAKVNMIGETSTSVGEIINRVPVNDEVVRWLMNYMTESAGPVPAKQAEDDGKIEGFSVHQLKRARARCRPQIVASKVGMTGPWMWSFAEESAKSAVTTDGALFSESAAPPRTLQEPK